MNQERATLSLGYEFTQIVCQQFRNSLYWYEKGLLVAAWYVGKMALKIDSLVRSLFGHKGNEGEQIGEGESVDFSQFDLNRKLSLDSMHMGSATVGGQPVEIVAELVSNDNMYTGAMKVSIRRENAILGSFSLCRSSDGFEETADLTKDALAALRQKGAQHQPLEQKLCVDQIEILEGQDKNMIISSLLQIAMGIFMKDEATALEFTDLSNQKGITEALIFAGFVCPKPFHADDPLHYPLLSKSKSSNGLVSQFSLTGQQRELCHRLYVDRSSSGRGPSVEVDPAIKIEASMPRYIKWDLDIKRDSRVGVI